MSVSASEASDASLADTDIKQSPGCSAVGTSAGAVDPKTHRKWVWVFIDAVANLVNVVVSKITVLGPVQK